MHEDKQLDLQRALLEQLAGSSREFALSIENFRVNGEMAKAFSTKLRRTVTPYDFYEAAWSLVGQRLAFWDMNGMSQNHWALRISEVGRRVVLEDDPNPHDRAGYLEWLQRSATGISATTFRYVDEAVSAFNQELYLACVITIGVAAESAFIEVLREFTRLLDGKAKTAIEDMLATPSTFVAKVKVFETRIEARLEMLPEELRDSYSLLVASVQDLLRRSRNNAGHPTGATFDRHECHRLLLLAAGYLRDLYEIKYRFEVLAAEKTAGVPT